jgi:hypothetical protein
LGIVVFLVGEHEVIRVGAKGRARLHPNPWA